MSSDIVFSCDCGGVETLGSGDIWSGMRQFPSEEKVRHYLEEHGIDGNSDYGFSISFFHNCNDGLNFCLSFARDEPDEQKVFMGDLTYQDACDLRDYLIAATKRASRIRQQHKRARRRTKA